MKTNVSMIIWFSKTIVLWYEWISCSLCAHKTIVSKWFTNTHWRGNRRKQDISLVIYKTNPCRRNLFNFTGFNYTVFLFLTNQN